MNLKIKKLVSSMLFIVILARSVELTTYLFRNIGGDRLHVIGMYEEGPLDMIYVGGSSAFTYWQPLKAFHDHGFTSYSYATNALQADSYIYYVREVLKTHRPKLFVMDIRTFQTIGSEFYEFAMRNASDSMDLFSMNRWGLIWDQMINKEITEETDVLSCYFDLAKYHTNTERLASPIAWQYIDNRAVCKNKGWEWIDSWAEMSEPIGFQSNQRGELNQRTMEVLIELLEFCKSEDIEALFVVSPYSITKDEQKKYNTMADIIQTYHYRFFNTNDYYKKMGIDFSTDFYNGNHANLFGAEKYTQFLSSYLKQTYDLPDHRREDLYASWNKEYTRYIQEEVQHKKTVSSMIEDAKKGKKIAVQIQEEDDLSEWAAMIEDARYMILLSESGTVASPVREAEKKILKVWGLSGGEQNAIRVISDTELIYTNEDNGAAVYEGICESGRDGTENIEFTIRVDDNSSSICVGQKEYGQNRRGMNVVVVDRNYLHVVDSVNITIQNKKMVLSRRNQ